VVLSCDDKYRGWLLTSRKAGSQILVYCTKFSRGHYIGLNRASFIEHCAEYLRNLLEKFIFYVVRKKHNVLSVG
jgi:hypothetical protein